MAEVVAKLAGFRGASWLRSTEDPNRSASILLFDTREQAGAALFAASAVLQKHRPTVAVRVAASGPTTFLAMA